ncbi:MAG TPA: S8 family serine peptidase [Jiangellales bacterium]|nr:S8 family serine peptidase [Jiangellales bacterium]
MAERRTNRQQVEDARATTRRLYGAELESKSTDEFCLAVQRSRGEARGPRASVGLETAGGGGAPGVAVASVVEFSPEDAAPVTPAGGISTGAERHRMVHETRTAAYQVLSPVYDEIERLSATPLVPAMEVEGAPRLPTLVTQVCWLNRTVRTWAGPAVLADVAADPAVTGVDVPRLLTADAADTGPTAPAGTLNHRSILLPEFVRATSLTGKGVTVAVIDSEVALRHPALAGRVVHRRNYTAEPWGTPHSHGTAVAGIIGGADVADGGIAPDVTLYNYKVLASSRLLNGDSFSGAIAIQQALEDGAQIANCSWGAGPVGPTKSREAIAAETAWALGMAVVKSAGNAGPNARTMTTPADADGIVVVGATGLDGRKVPDYSSRGPAGANPGPHLVAPGGDDAGKIACVLVTGGFGDAGAGTSYAAPHVSGALALLLEQDPTLTPDQLRDRLRSTARSVGRTAVAAQGAGLLQLVDPTERKPPRRRRSTGHTGS